MEKHRFRVFEKMVPRRIFVTKREEVQGGIKMNFIICTLHRILGQSNQGE
jgi:hypothetical protein